MPHTVTLLPGQQQFPSDPEETLLDAALRHGVTLPYGCRNGACGACKGKVLQGTVDHGQANNHALSTAERADGMTLFCCAQARSDLVIECREVSGKDLRTKTLPARVQRMTRASADVMILHLQLPASERLQFLAGQYIDILLKDGRQRSFSLANAPHDDAVLELHVRHVPGGIFTDHVFTAMKERDILRLKGPLGTFYLREDSARPLVLIAGGTGFAPVKGLVEHAIHHGITRPINLYWGARTRNGLYMAELATRWAAEHPHIRFVPVLSEPTPADAWTGRTGLVHRAVLEDFDDLAGHQVYACGAPAMVDAARQDCTTLRNLPLNEFFADAFSFANDTP